MRCAMNHETALQNFLASAQESVLERLRLQRRLEELEQRCSALTNRRSAVARRLKARLSAEYRRELDLTCRELEQYRRVEAFIAKLKEPSHRMILRHRYLEVGRNWSAVQRRLAQDGLPYSARQLTRLHADAIEAARLLWMEEGEEESDRERR